ncbi:MAG: hypothetical protein ACRD44_10610 [Bryobacteraceae bacterium]
MRDPDSGQSHPPVSAPQIVHAATFESGPLAPNMLVSIFPPEPAAAAFFGPGEAPLLFRSALQINTATPEDLAAGGTVRVSLRDGDRTVWEGDVGVVESAPGLFAAQNEDFQLNTESNPAAPGSIVGLYGTGAGRAGSHVVRIGGLAGEMIYAGPVPGLHPALTQINVRVPAALGAGRHSVVWIAGRFAGPAGFIVWVR